MSRNLDLSQPLDAETLELLRERHSDDYIARMVSIAGAVEQAPEEDPEEAPEAPEEDLIGTPEEAEAEAPAPAKAAAKK